MLKYEDADVVLSAALKVCVHDHSHMKEGSVYVITIVECGKALVKTAEQMCFDICSSPHRPPVRCAI